MKNIIKKDIAVVIQNSIQFQSIKNGIDILISKGKNIDIYIPKMQDEDGYGNMFNEFYNNISKSYSIKRDDIEDIEYKILLEPYVTDSYFKLNYKYRIKYKYSSISAKPNPVYKPELNLCYDGIICFGEYEANYLSTYSKPLIIGNMKYENFKRNTVGKPILLYLPTFGQHSYIEEFVNEIDNLKKEYEIVVKMHHGTSFLIKEKKRVELLEKKCDRCYDQNTELAKLLEEASVVLSDNSGSIFEAIYANVPVGIFAKDINDTKLGNFDTTQYMLVKKEIVPYTNNAKEILNILKKAKSEEYFEKQKKWRNKAFYIEENQTIRFVENIEKYLNDDEEIVRYKNMHDILKEEYYANKKTVIEKQNYILEQKHHIEILTNMQKEYENKIENLEKIKKVHENKIEDLEEIKRENENKLRNLTKIKKEYEVRISNNNVCNMRLEQDIQNLNNIVQKQNLELEIYKNSKLYIIAEKLYKIINKVRRKR